MDTRWWRKRCVLSMYVVVFCLAAIVVAPGSSSGEDQKEAKLSFALPEGTALQYETSWAMEYYYMSMDIVQNQSYEVDMNLLSVTGEGNFHVSLNFKDASSSMVIGDDIQDWTPPVQLEGNSILVDVASNGEVLEAKPGGNIPGMRDPKELKSIAEVWFINLPDTVKQVGDSWRKDIEEGSGEAEEGEEEEPAAKGWADFSFKKIEKKKDIVVAVIEVETKLDINQPTPGGMLRGKGEGEGKYYIALEGGYIVEGKSEFEIKGKIVSADGKETDTAITRYYETKLKK